MKKTCSKKTINFTQDIFELHEKILNILNNEHSELPSLKKKLANYLWIYNNSDNRIDRQDAIREYEKLNKNVQLIESGYRHAKYIHDTEEIIQEYKKLLDKPFKINFMAKSTDIIQDTERQNIIIKFLNIAKNYIDIKPIEGLRKNLLCDDCTNVQLQREDDFLFICPICGFAIKHFASISGYQETTRINVAQRYVYDKKAHFGDAIKKFQGKQNTTISQQVYQDVLNKIKNHNIPVEKFTMDHLHEFLKLTKHSDHYEDMALIYSEITKIKPPNINHLEKKLYELFDEIDPVYERIKPEGRTNFLNGQFVLFKLLQKLKYPCKESDFYILKTRDKMLEHDQIWKIICNELSWTYIPTV